MTSDLDEVTDRLETGFGHGKVILMGEHAVGYGQPAIAAGLPAGIQAVVTKGTGKLSVPAWKVHCDLQDTTPLARAVAGILTTLEASEIDITCDAQIPGAAGLGSSAALAVAITRAVGRYVRAPEEQQQKAIWAAESVFHDTPSGVDTAAAASGCLGLFSHAAGWKPLTTSHTIDLCIGLSGKPHQTSALVKSVKQLCDRTPVARRVIDNLGDVSRAGLEAIKVGDIDTLGRLFDVAHGLLCALRVSSPELDSLVHTARNAGALGAKLTGAGGGGAVIALAPGHANDVLAAWTKQGFAGFVTTIGGSATS